MQLSQLRAFDLQGQELRSPDQGIGVIFGYAPSSIGYAANDLGDISYAFSSPNTAPSVFSFRLDSEESNKWAAVSTFGFDFSDIDVRLVRYPSADGTMVPAFLYVPKTAQKNGQNPAIAGTKFFRRSSSTTPSQTRSGSIL